MKFKLLRRFAAHTIFALLILCLLAISAVAQTSSARITKSFDADWRFLKGNAESAQNANFDDSAWRKLNVPHDWSIEGPFDAKNPTGGAGGFLPSGVSWYRKHFTVSDKDKARRFFIEFDGVLRIRDVWINCFHPGQPPLGSVSIEYDRTDHMNFGKDNVLAVRVDTTL